MRMNLLEVTHLRKTYDDLVAVEDVSFSVAPGEVFGLLGPNGAGKSTTMMMICGLLQADSGEVRIDGQPLTRNNRALRKLLGVVPQDLAIYPELTARENLRFFGRLYGVTGSLLKQRVESSLEMTGLTDRAEEPVDNFSGGMKRRLNFGVALLHNPRLLILDEPTVGVDPQSRSHLLDCVRHLNAEGKSAIYASHYMEEVQSICHRVAIIDHGRMIACDELRHLLGRMSSELRLLISAPTNGLLEKLNGMAEIKQISDGEAAIVISHDQHRDEQKLNASLRKVLSLLDESHVKLHAVETEEPNLERLFLDLTGNRLRD
jgi:ABC-2 type transport system ATP-binding protein